MTAHEFDKNIIEPSRMDPASDNIIICEIDRQMIPGAIVYASKPVASLLGYTPIKLMSIPFSNICSFNKLYAGVESGDSFHFQANLKKIDGSLLLCNFKATVNSDLESLQIQFVIKPVENSASTDTVTLEVIKENKFRIFDECSHGVGHDVNNAVNLITLSIDLLREISTELDSAAQRLDPSLQIHGMSTDKLSKTINYLSDNISSSALKISTTIQSLFQFSRTESTQSGTFDVRKMLQAVVTIAECAIRKVSPVLHFEPPQGIIKRTGNPLQIQQALLNCILFLCNNSNANDQPFYITTAIIHNRSEFCITIAHGGCKPLSTDFISAFSNVPSSIHQEFSDHPLIIAQSLILTNGGSIMLRSENPSGIEFNISFSMLCNIF
jgi:hypothetical protein